MSAVAYIRDGTRATASPAASISPAKPTVNGLAGALVALVTSKNNAVHNCATAGWTKIDQQNSGAAFTASLWIARETAAAPTFTWTGSVACSAQLIYYADPNDPIDLTIAAISASVGATNPHTSTAIVATQAGALAAYFDCAAANTVMATPSGWTENDDTGSATDNGREVYGSKTLATVGASSGAISVTGAAAEWVQWQVELRTNVGAQLEANKVELGGWIEPTSALGPSKIELVGWLDIGSFGTTKEELVAWLDVAEFGCTREELVAWLDTASLDVTREELVAWLESGAPPAGGRRMSLM